MVMIIIMAKITNTHNKDNSVLTIIIMV